MYSWTDYIHEIWDQNLTILFCLGDAVDTLFSTSSTGVVTVTGTLDREILDFYSISVTVGSKVQLMGGSILRAPLP